MARGLLFGPEPPPHPVPGPDLGGHPGAPDAPGIDAPLLPGGLRQQQHAYFSPHAYQAFGLAVDFDRQIYRLPTLILQGTVQGVTQHGDLGPGPPGPGRPGMGVCHQFLYRHALLLFPGVGGQLPPHDRRGFLQVEILMGRLGHRKLCPYGPRLGFSSCRMSPHALHREMVTYPGNGACLL